MKMKRYGVRPINKPAVTLVSESDIKEDQTSDIDDLLEKIRAIYSNASGAAVDFFNYVGKKFNISVHNTNGFVNTLKMLCAGIAGIGAGRYLAKVFTGVVYYSNRIVARIASPAFKELIKDKEVLKVIHTIDKQVLLFIIVSSTLSLAFYKLYKVLISSVVSDAAVEESIATKYKDLAIYKSIIESSVFFDKCARVADASQFTESDAENSANGIMARASKVCKEMFDDISRRGSSSIKKHQSIITAILLSIGFVSVFVRV